MNKENSNRSFGLVFYVVLFLIAFWSFRGEHHQIKLLPLSFSIIFLILGLLNSKLLTPFNKIWGIARQDSRSINNDVYILCYRYPFKSIY